MSFFFVLTKVMDPQNFTFASENGQKRPIKWEGKENAKRSNNVFANNHFMVKFFSLKKALKKTTTKT